jgi:hypothetical protein
MKMEKTTNKAVIQFTSFAVSKRSNAARRVLPLRARRCIICGTQYIPITSSRRASDTLERGRLQGETSKAGEAATGELGVRNLPGTRGGRQRAVELGQSGVDLSYRDSRRPDWTAFGVSRILHAWFAAPTTSQRRSRWLHRLRVSSVPVEQAGAPKRCRSLRGAADCGFLRLLIDAMARREPISRFSFLGPGSPRCDAVEALFGGATGAALKAPRRAILSPNKQPS